jgi:hypothetical protein
MKTIKLPKTIVLNLQRELDEFRRQLAEFDLNHDTTAESIIETLWENFAFEDTRDENLWTTLNEIVDDEIGYDNNHDVAMKFEGIVHFFGSALYDQIDLHNFYDQIGYLPYNLKFHPGNIIAMERDDDLCHLQNEYSAGCEEDDKDAVLVEIPPKKEDMVCAA